MELLNSHITHPLFAMPNPFHTLIIGYSLIPCVVLYIKGWSLRDGQ